MRDLRRLMGHDEDDHVQRFRDIIDLDEQQECIRAAYALGVLTAQACAFTAHIIAELTSPHNNPWQMKPGNLT